MTYVIAQGASQEFSTPCKVVCSGASAGEFSIDSGSFGKLPENAVLELSADDGASVTISCITQSITVISMTAP